MISYSENITDKAGREAQISGSSDLIDRIGSILEANGFKWNHEVECWDEGFYETSINKGLTVHPSGSIECPHCHWGFHPSVIQQHIHEKH